MFFSFSNFKNLHQLIKSFIIPILNRVYSQSKCYFLKSDSNNLNNSNNLKNLKIDLLQTKQTITHTRKLQSVPKDKVCKVCGTMGFNLIIRLFCRRGFRSTILTTIHIHKIFNIQTTPNQWMRKSKRHKIHH